ncbi:MAG: hypothetical protein KL801_00210 [Mesorhizobium sp.]|nr:hypothetical protein [Mesorhizobium sp.]
MRQPSGYRGSTPWWSLLGLSGGVMPHLPLQFLLSQTRSSLAVFPTPLGRTRTTAEASFI